jgi:tetratricopeptide (TPR) repeat protein
VSLAWLTLLGGRAHAQQKGFDEAWNKGQDYFNLAKYDEARAQFDKARKLAPTLPGPWRYLGKIAKIQQRWADCVDAYVEAIKLKPDSNNADEVRADLESCRSALGRPSFTGTLPNGFGALAVSSNVEGARVSVDGIGKGATPLAPSPLPAGKHVVQLEKEGYLPAEVRVEVVVTVVVDLDVQLKVDPKAKRTAAGGELPTEEATVGWIAIVTNAAGVGVLIDGKVPPSGPQASYEATPGDHLLEVSAPGHETYRRRIRVARGQKRTLNVELQSTDALHSQRRMGYVFFGVATAAAASGVVFGLLENDKYEQARDAYEIEQERPPNAGSLPADLPEAHVTTRAEYEDMRDEADGYALISNVSYGVAVVALAVSAYYFIESRPDQREGYPPPVAKRSHWTPTVLAGGARGVGGALTFTQELDW